MIIDVFEAKTHFSQLLTKVENGEVIIITRHGESIAKIIPFTEEKISSSSIKAVETIRRLRKGKKLGKSLSIKKMIAEGRE